MATSLRVLVMGAINQDEVARVRQHPKPGETVVTDRIDLVPGGKGANQAVAAAATGLDVDVQFLGAVGDDAAGDRQLQALSNAGVDTSLIRRVMGTPTGRAHITVSDVGENSVVVGLGANAFVSRVNINGALRPSVVVGQTEIGSSPIDALAEFAIACNARLVLNNAPVVSLSERTLRAADPLVLNELEAADTLDQQGFAWDTVSPTDLAALLLRQVGCKSVVVTLGPAGCVVAQGAGVRHFDAVPVQRVVDTTGAGDCFVGTLAAALAVGETLHSATERALRAAAVAVTLPGARTPEPSVTT